MRDPWITALIASGVDCAFVGISLLLYIDIAQYTCVYKTTQIATYNDVNMGPDTEPASEMVSAEPYLQPDTCAIVVPPALTLTQYVCSQQTILSYGLPNFSASPLSRSDPPTTRPLA